MIDIKDNVSRNLAIVKFHTVGPTTTESTEYFVHGTERIARVTDENAGDEQLHFSEATFFLYDHLGNTRVSYKVNASSVRQTIYAADSFPYGKILREYVDGDGGDRYLSTAHERDKETGLDYRGARYYDSDIARFLSIDPWAAKYPGWNPYNYVVGNPLIFIDPTGKGVEWKPTVKDGFIRLLRETGDNAETLADYLDVDQEAANELWNARCEDGSIYLNTTVVPNIDIIMSAISEYTKSPDNYDGGRNYDCHESSFSLLTSNYIDYNNEIQGFQLSTKLNSKNFVDVSEKPSDYIFAKTLIRFGNSAGNTKHSATYLGTSSDGTIFTWSKNGNSTKPGIYTVDQLEKIYGAEIQGIRAESGGGFYNPIFYEYE